MKYSSFGAGFRLLVQREMRCHLQHEPTSEIFANNESEKSPSTFACKARVRTSTSRCWLLLVLRVPVREKLFQTEIGQRVFDKLLENRKGHGTDMATGQSRLNHVLRVPNTGHQHQGLVVVGLVDRHNLT